MISLMCGAAGGGGEAGGNFWTCCRLINQLFLAKPGQTTRSGETVLYGASSIFHSPHSEGIISPLSRSHNHRTRL